MAYIQEGIAVSLIFASATANTTAPTPNVQTGQNPPAAQAKPPKPVTYCLEMEPFTGSRTTTRECMTREQWAKEGVDVDHLPKQ